MPVPVRTYATSPPCPLRWLALLVLLAATPLFAGGPPPAIRIPLDSLGFQPQATQFLTAGSSMLTVDYVDDRHLLFTFGVHRLMARIANDPPDDQDRTVEAVLVEVPSGNVLARTDWRLHDNGQYLWNMGHGRFMLRTHDSLTTFAPMANLASGQPFRQRDFLTMVSERRMGVVLLSPESDLMIVESVERMPPVPDPPASLFGPSPKPAPAILGRPGDPDPVALGFYRLAMPGKGDEVKATLAGVAHASHFGEVAAMGVGHIAVVDEGRQQWGFDFRPYNGKAKELAPFASTCDPTPRLVSNSEFVAFGCHGGNSPTILGGFNLNGEEMWEQNLSGDYVATFMSFAPESGRFALGRVLGQTATDDIQPVSGAGFNGQSIVVIQMESGKQILHVDCTPIVRAGQNFALSPNGMGLAVIRNDAIEVYNLPPLSKKDQADVKEARSLIPQESILPIEFAGPTAEPAAQPADQPVDQPAVAQPATAPANSPASTAASPVSPGGVQPVSAPAATAPAAAPPAPANSATAGDAAPVQPRKPPTLYTLPGDKNGGGADEETK
jgi:hypothetical protein